MKVAEQTAEKRRSVSGVERAWELVKALSPEETCGRAGVTFDAASRCFRILSFGQEMRVSLPQEQVSSPSAIGEFLLHEIGYFFDLALLWYLAHAQDVPLAGQLIRPADITGGQIFVQGTHVLPLTLVADQFGRDPYGFVKRGESLGGRPLPHGDAALELRPFPRLTVTIVLWVEDEEFPARVDLFFDASCERHLPADVLWSMAMVAVLAMASK